MATCCKSKKPFAIRAELQDKVWYFTWAFKIREDAAKHEGYDKTEVGGALGLTSEYPGCPYCGAPFFYQCGRCHRIVCDSGQNKVVKCPDCGNEGELMITDKFDTIKGETF